MWNSRTVSILRCLTEKGAMKGQSWGPKENYFKFCKWVIFVHISMWGEGSSIDQEIEGTKGREGDDGERLWRRWKWGVESGTHLVQMNDISSSEGQGIKKGII